MSSYNIKKGRPKRAELYNDRTNFIDQELESEKRSKIYNTQIINKILDDINHGRKTDMTPFFHGDVSWRNTDITFEYTPEEYEELLKCAEDAEYFIEKYCTFLTDTGRKTVQLRQYQKDVIKLACSEKYNKQRDMMVPENRRIVLLQSRQTGKTTTTAAMFTWYLCFHTDRNAKIVANKKDTALEVFSKIAAIFKGLPYFLKPGVLSTSKSSIEFENGCTMKCSATTASAATGDTLHMLLIDECALIPNNIMNEFWQSVWPTMSSSEISQVIVLSTPRGKHNLYYDLYNGAVNNTNGFVHKRVDYWEVPGHDTDEWRAEQIAAFGEANFNQEFGLSFDSDASKLISPTDLKYMSRIKKEFQPVDIYSIPYNISSNIYWHPDFHPEHLTTEELLNSRFLLQVDTAEGQQAGEKGKEDQDWNIINIYKIELLSPARILRNRMGYKEVKMKDCVRLRQVGIYMDHVFNEEKSAEAARYIVFNLFRNGQQLSEDLMIDNCRIMIETNFNGTNWIKKFVSHEMFYSSLIVKTLHSQRSVNKEFGFKTVGGAKGKGYWCETGAKLIAQKQIIISQDSKVPVMSSIQQLESFGKTKNGTYKGDSMHDDIAITILFACIAFEQDEFIYWLDDWLEQLKYTNTNEEIANKIERINEFLNTYSSSSQVFDDMYSDDDVINLYTNASNSFNSQNFMPNNNNISNYNSSSYNNNYRNNGYVNSGKNVYRQQNYNPYRNSRNVNGYPSNF